MDFKEMIKKNTIRTISLFSGAGGLDIGAIRAGANIIWANDIKQDACESYRTNIGDHIHIGDINMYMNDFSAISNVDLVIGGPPCQGFSVAGKMDRNDERSKLIWNYVDVVEATNPKAFIMENVKALATLSRWQKVRDKLLLRLRNLGYSVSFIVLNASEYDVPQARERVFFIGFKGDETKYPDLERMMSFYKKKSGCVREALALLDVAGTGNNINTCNAKITLSSTPIMRKSPYAGMLFNGLGRPIKIDGYSATLPASMGGNKTPIIDEEALYQKKRPWVESYHKRLSQNNGVAISTEVPHFLRRLTVDEARLIQTFPLNYHFCGSQSSQYTQIGNAVPCNLAFAVCSMVVDVLLGTRNILYNGFF